MITEELWNRLVRLQTELTETSREPRNSYAYTITRPKLLGELKRAIEEAYTTGATEDDIDELVAELEVTTERRPVELENFWDPRRMAKGWGKRS